MIALLRCCDTARNPTYRRREHKPMTHEAFNLFHAGWLIAVAAYRGCLLLLELVPRSRPVCGCPTGRRFHSSGIAHRVASSRLAQRRYETKGHPLWALQERLGQAACRSTVLPRLLRPAATHRQLSTVGSWLMDHTPAASPSSCCCTLDSSHP